MFVINKTKIYSACTYVILPILLFSCKNETQVRSTNHNKTLKETQIQAEFHTDTNSNVTIVPYGNITTKLNIKSTHTYKNQRLLESSFSVWLGDHDRFFFRASVPVNRLIQREINSKSPKEQHANSINTVIIKSIRFDFIRGNALFFKAILWDLDREIEIPRKFQMIYRGRRKGLLESYGYRKSE